MWRRLLQGWEPWAWEGQPARPTSWEEKAERLPAIHGKTLRRAAIRAAEILGLLLLLTTFTGLMIIRDPSGHSGLALAVQDPGLVGRVLRAALEDPGGLAVALLHSTPGGAEALDGRPLVAYGSPLSGGIPTSGLVHQAFAPPSWPSPGSPEPVRLRIPRLGMEVPVVPAPAVRVRTAEGEWTVWETPPFAAGHHQGSAGAGRPGNVVLSGHNNARGEVFRRLAHLRPGDRILLLDAAGREHVYLVRARLVVPETAVPHLQRAGHGLWLLPTREPVLTLVSAWPYWTNTHRVIVRASLR